MSDTNDTSGRRIPDYQIGAINADHVDTDADSFDFCVDTAGSWDGTFPDVGRGDYLVTVGSIGAEDQEILVSRRYTSACDPQDAASIALDAFNEMGTGIPCRVYRVDIVID